MAFTLDDFCTLSEVKELKGIMNNDNDALLSQIITRTSSFIRKYTDRYLLSETFTNELQDSYWSPNLNLDHYPVTTFNSLEVSCDTVDQTFDTIASTAFNVDERAGIVYYPCGFPNARLNVRLNYIAGYLADTDDHNYHINALKQICIDITIKAFDSRKFGQGKIKKFQAGNYEIEFFESASDNKGRPLFYSDTQRLNLYKKYARP